MRFIDNNKIIRGTYDTKAMLMGGGDAVRLKAEVDIDGRELTRRYLEKESLKELLKVISIPDSRSSPFALFHSYFFFIFFRK